MRLGRPRIGGFTTGVTDLFDMLSVLGVGPFNAPMAIQFAFMMPRTTDGDAPGVLVLVDAAQNGLRSLGYRVEDNGVFGPMTQAAIAKVSGPRWRDKTWAQILGDIISAPKRSRGAHVGLGETFYELEALGDSFGGLTWSHTARGSCSPSNTATLNAFKRYQHAANRVASKIGVGQIAEDGVLGDRTVDQARKIGWSKHANASAIPGIARSGLGAVVDCDGLARISEAMTSVLETVANQLGASSGTRPPSNGAVVTQAPDGTIVVKERSGFMQALTSPIGLAAIGVGGLLLLQGGKKRRKRR